MRLSLSGPPVASRQLVAVLAPVLMGLGAVSPSSSQPSSAASAQRIDLLVTETAGIRRFNYPVHARVPFAAGELDEAGHTRLLRSDETEVESQIAAQSTWPDGSVQWLSVHFNTSIGPGASQSYWVEHGAGVAPTPERPRGLSLVEGPDGLQVGSLRFSRTGVPVIASVTYRDEAISPGRNGFRAVGAGGEVYRLVNPLDLEIRKRGPLYVELRYEGQLTSAAGDHVPFVMTAGMPNSKSWVKLAATVDDPAARVRELLLDLPFSLGPHPWVWDFGTERWTYGALRGVNERVELTQVVTAPDAVSHDWEITLEREGQSQSYEVGTGGVVGWGHLQGGREVVAFAIEGIGGRPGTLRVALAGSGQTTFGFTPSTSSRRHQLTVYNHYVSTPVQIGAATSPSAMLNPLRAVCEPERYDAAGLEQPRP